METPTFSVLCIGLDGESRRSAEGFLLTTMAGKITKTHFADTVRDASRQILKEGCPYDAVLTMRELPDSFFRAQGDDQSFDFQSNVKPGETIVAAALRANDKTKCILYVTPDESHGHPFGEDESRVYYGREQAPNWELLFFLSELFADRYAQFRYDPCREPANA